MESILRSPACRFTLGRDVVPLMEYIFEETSRLASELAAYIRVQFEDTEAQDQMWRPILPSMSETHSYSFLQGIKTGAQLQCGLLGTPELIPWLPG